MFSVLNLLCVISIFCVSSFGCAKSDPEVMAQESPSPVKNQLSNVIVTDRQIPQILSLPEGLFQPFYIYLDKGSNKNHYVPSGFMPNGKCLALNEGWTQNCYSGENCLRIEYDLACSRKDQKWAGMYWLNPANNWGQRKGGFNLTGAQKLTFWARGDKGNEQIQEFTIGGITGNYPDSDLAVLGPVILSNEWRQYTIDLRGKDFSYLSGGFAWSTSAEVNDETCTFYLDDIRFE